MKPSFSFLSFSSSCSAPPLSHSICSRSNLVFSARQHDTYTAPTYNCPYLPIFHAKTFANVWKISCKKHLEESENFVCLKDRKYGTIQSQWIDISCLDLADMANYIAIQYLLKQIIGACKLFLSNNMYQETFHVKETWCKHKCMIRWFLNSIIITCIQNVGFNWEKSILQFAQIYFAIQFEFTSFLCIVGGRGKKNVGGKELAGLASSQQLHRTVTSALKFLNSII